MMKRLMATPPLGLNQYNFVVTEKRFVTRLTRDRDKQRERLQIIIVLLKLSY